MSNQSAIEWTDATWNPATGCTKVSPACAHCYIERQTPMRIAGRRFVKGHIPIELHPTRLFRPEEWKTPQRVFVNSMSDLFHEDIPLGFISDVYHTMEQRAPWHTYQVLTKRPERMMAYLAWRYGEREDGGGSRIPARHIWHGVSVENAAFKDRIDILRETRSAVRFLSIEPLLGDIGVLDLRGINWVIVGGESGPKHRPMRIEWVRAIQQQCAAAHVAFFFKQWGGATPKSGGRLLDERTFDEYPELAHV